MRKLTHEDYVKSLEIIDSPLRPTESYLGDSVKIKHICKNGHITEKLPTHAKNGSGCRQCYFDLNRKTIVQYRKDLNRKFKGDFIVLGDVYINAMTAIPHKCVKCGHSRDYLPNDILSRVNPCPYCSGEFMSHERYIKKLYSIRKNVKLLDKFNGFSKYLSTKCLDCGNIWKAPPGSLLTSKMCPICAKDTVASGALRATHRRRTYNLGKLGKVKLQGYEPQAIDWLRRRGIKLSDIAFSVRDGKPTIKYTLLGKQHTYFPDFYIRSTNTIVEVKCEYTLGITHLKIFRMVSARARATLAAGYKISTMVMSKDGRRLKLPKGWYNMKRKELVSWLSVNRKYHK